MPLLVLAKVEVAVNTCLVQHEEGRKFVFEHPASASSWNVASLRRLAEISGIYSFDSDLLKIHTNSETIDELIDKRCRVDGELDVPSCDSPHSDPWPARLFLQCDERGVVQHFY